MTHSFGVNTPFSELAKSLDGELHTDFLRCHLLATDASIFKQIPVAVAYPKSTADVQAVVRYCRDHGLSVHPRGAGSGLCGAAVGMGVVLDFSKYMNRLRRIDLQAGWVECEPGYRFGELEAALTGTGLFFPPDPSSGEYATFGGMMGTNASGAHSVKYGNVADYVLDAQVVFADGSLARLSDIADRPIEDLPENLQGLARMYECHAAGIEAAYCPVKCNVAGYNLRQMVRGGRLYLHHLLAGAEGTLGIVTRLRLRLIERPAADSLVVAYFDDILTAARAVQLAIPRAPSGIEVMDKSLLELARKSDSLLARRIAPGIDNVLMIEFDGPTREDCSRSADELLDALQAAGLTDKAYRAVSAEEKRRFWTLRKAAVPILYKLKGHKKILALVEDAAVPLEALVPYFKGIYEIFQHHGVAFVLYGHIAKGLMHTRPLLDLKDSKDVGLLKPLADDVYALVAGLGGTVSGEHGDGRLRSAYIKRRYPTIYDRFLEVKQWLDPDNMLNPDIITNHWPDQMMHHLRFGTGYGAVEPSRLHLHWPATFVGEAERCHGCSKCTTVTTATRMCPVYKVTRDEAASPKAKANILRALLSGAIQDRDLYRDGFQHVMAQCVNCGSCYLECPSNVNIPKLAMEVKARYADRFGISLPDGVTAHVETAAGLTHRFSAIIAAAVRRPLVRTLSARLTGLAAQREPVVFARRSLYHRMPQIITGKGPSLLFFAGCYAGLIRPALGQAAMQVLAHMGFEVRLPPQHCCGLPQLSKGMAGGARAKVRQNLDRWRTDLARVDYIVVTCSSCGYALMNDWAYLLPHDSAIGQISAKTRHITHLLYDFQDRLTLGQLPVRMAYHHPCHLRIQPRSHSTLSLLAHIPGAKVVDLQSNCCGIAGSWGMIAKNYELSRSIGRPMIAALNASGAHCGVTDCPTCQMQMEHLGNLPVRHPVEIVLGSLNSVAVPASDMIG
jgi:FAD/FMN-containing dehydrogenase/Fe-S oxidoreductase